MPCGLFHFGMHFFIISFDETILSKRESERVTKEYVIIEEDQITEQEREYAESMLYEAILVSLKTSGVLSAEQLQDCRIRNQMRMRKRR